MNTFPRRRAAAPSMSLRRVAELLECPPPQSELEIRGVRPLEAAEPTHLGFLADRHYLPGLKGSRAGALLLSRPLADEAAEDTRPRLVVEDAHRALAMLLEHFHPEEELEPEIHPTAVLGTGVRLGRDVRIGPYAVLEDGVEAGDRARIGTHSVVGAGARLGSDVVLHPHVVLYPGTVVGDRVILHAGVRLGVDGFGYVLADGGHRKVPQVGGCVIEDDVEIGANTTVDRGSIGETRVGAGAKLDNLVQLGHNVSIGPRSMLAGQAGVAGSTRIGSGVLAGGQAGIGGHLRIGDGARLAGQAGITADVAAGDEVMGFPARSRREFLRTMAAQKRVPELTRRVRELERIVAGLTDASGEAGKAEGGGPAR